MNQREAVHFQAVEQRLRELAELITALGGTLRGQSALVEGWRTSPGGPAPGAIRRADAFAHATSQKGGLPLWLPHRSQLRSATL
jgi:hypothetical protein